MKRLAPLPRVLVLLLATVACGPPVPSTPLATAAWTGDTAAVTGFLAGGSAADTPDGAWTPLMWAARGGRTTVIALLLDHGADVNRHDARFGWTPLMHALHAHQGGAARLLLARGADPRLGGNGDGNPLTMATLDNDTGLMAVMLEAGTTEAQRKSAFGVAVSGGVLEDLDRPLLGSCHTEAVKLLKERDPSLTVEDGAGPWSALWWARVKACSEVVGLVTRPSVDAGSPPAHASAAGSASASLPPARRR